MMTVRIEFPFAAEFQVADIGHNSREVRTDLLQNYLLQSGMELGHDLESFQVTQFHGEDNGEFWTVECQT